MDNYLDRNRLKPLLSTMANTEAHQLRAEASSVAFRHLKELTTRSHFRDEVDRFIASQLQGIKSARTENECRACLQNIQLERRYIRDQDMALSMGQAKLYASAELRHTLDGWGYVINGVSVVLGGIQVITGIGFIAASLTHANIIGLGTGGLMILHGLSNIQEAGKNIITGRNDSVGFARNGYREIAKFAGFDSRIGDMVFSTADLLLSGYGLVRMVLKPNAWRLFYFMPSDFVRNFRTLSAPSLVLEGVGDTLSIKSAYNAYSAKN